MKKILLICAAIAALTLAATYCTRDNQDPQEEEPSEVILENPVPVTIDVEILNDWVFDKRPVFPLHITNPNNVKFKQVFKVKYYTDKNNTTIPALAEEREIEIPAEGFDMQVSTQQDLDPGFYKVYISIGRMVRTFTFGINPAEIVSAPDKQSDFNKFWQDAKTQLDAIEMAAQPTSDMNNLFAEGSSQGGALSYAAAALSDYPFTAIAPAVAFLGDFPDYFRIVGWPANTAKKNQGSMTDEEMYAFLSYFDTKNLVTLFSPQTAVIACIGLQDGTCPPHTNIAPYNNLPGSDKEIYYYPKLGHEIPNGWYNKYGNFFKARMK